MGSANHRWSANHIKTVNRLNNFCEMANLPKVFFRCGSQKLGFSDLMPKSNDSVVSEAVRLGKCRNNSDQL